MPLASQLELKSICMYISSRSQSASLRAELTGMVLGSDNFNFYVGGGGGGGGGGGFGKNLVQNFYRKNIQERVNSTVPFVFYANKSNGCPLRFLRCLP